MLHYSVTLQGFQSACSLIETCDKNFHPVLLQGRLPKAGGGNLSYFVYLSSLSPVIKIVLDLLNKSVYFYTLVSCHFL